jgi:hypothetical protein
VYLAKKWPPRPEGWGRGNIAATVGRIFYWVLPKERLRASRFAGIRVFTMKLDRAVLHQAP